MVAFRVRDWDDAYANPPNIPGGERWPERWAADAAAFREANGGTFDLAYGSHPREVFDLFAPSGTPKGLAVFVHGGFWLRMDKSHFAHLAAGPLAHGFAVAVPSYPLAPEVRVAAITRAIATAIGAAAERVDGPIHLAGHSAGGHLVTRQMCADSPLAPALTERLARVVSISGLHDLRPLSRLSMNEGIRLDDAEADAESPALKRPRPEVPLTCWVGAGERAEFIRQNALLANIWHGLDAPVEEIVEPDRHHFNVIDGLADPHHPLCRALVG